MFRFSHDYGMNYWEYKPLGDLGESGYIIEQSNGFVANAGRKSFISQSLIDAKIYVIALVWAKNIALLNEEDED